MLREMNSLLTTLASVCSITTIPRWLISLTPIFQHAAANSLFPNSAGGISSRGEQMDGTRDSDAEPDKKQGARVSKPCRPLLAGSSKLCLDMFMFVMSSRVISWVLNEALQPSTGLYSSPAGHDDAACQWISYQHLRGAGLARQGHGTPPCLPKVALEDDGEDKSVSLHSVAVCRWEGPEEPENHGCVCQQREPEGLCTCWPGCTYTYSGGD